MTFNILSTSQPRTAALIQKHIAEHTSWLRQLIDFMEHSNTLEEELIKTQTELAEIKTRLAAKETKK